MLFLYHRFNNKLYLLCIEGIWSRGAIIRSGTWHFEPWKAGDKDFFFAVRCNVSKDIAEGMGKVTMTEKMVITVALAGREHLSTLDNSWANTRNQTLDSLPYNLHDFRWINDYCLL